MQRNEKQKKQENALSKVNVRIDGDRMVTTSRNVAEVFGRQHNHVLRDIRELEKDVSDFGQMFFQTTEPDAYGRPQTVYLMNRDGFSLLAMGFTGASAIQWKLKYIEAFNALEKAWNSPEQIMARALKLADSQINNLRIEVQDLQEKIETDRPKVLFADAVAASDSSILIGQLAKILRQNGIDTGQNRLFKWMRRNGYLCQTGQNYNLPMQKSMEMELFEIKERTINNPDGTIRITKTVLVTGKGQRYFIDKFLNAA